MKDYTDEIIEAVKEHIINDKSGTFANESAKSYHFISGVNSKIAEKIRIEFAIKQLDRINFLQASEGISLEEACDITLKELEQKLKEL